MRIMGIDPGATTGWVIYDTEAMAVVECGHFPDDCNDVDISPLGMHVVIERPKGQGPTRPELVDCGIVAGLLFERVRQSRGAGPFWMTRLQVKQALTNATHGEVHVKNDATAWAALVLLHGEGSDRKATKKHGPAGPIGAVTGHARAALAVAVAFALTDNPTTSRTR